MLAVVLLLQQVSPEEVGKVLSRAQPTYIALLLLAIAIGLVTRALRWGAYFQPERRVRFGPLFGTLSISYMASTFLPFRAGELVRAVFLGQREAIPVPRVVGTILIEKLFDFLALAVMLAVLLVTTPLPTVAQVAGTSIATVILLGFGFVVALSVWRTQTLSLVKWVERRIPLGLGARLRFTRATAQFATGTDSLRHLRLWGPMLGWTAVTWFAAYLQNWAGLQALGIPADAAVLTYLIVVTSTGQAVPSSPGYVGVYHAAAVLALTTFGVSQADALGAAVLIHALSYGSLVITGLVALWVGGYGMHDVLGANRAASEAQSSKAMPPERIPV